MAKAKVYEQYEKHYDEEAKVHYYVNARTGALVVVGIAATRPPETAALRAARPATTV